MGDPTSPSLDFNVLLAEIEAGSGGSIAAAIRKLREHEISAYQAGIGGPTGELVASFISSLDSHAKDRVGEIEKTCAHHYQGFLEATRELLSVQNEAAKLQKGIQNLNESLSASVVTFRNACEDLSKCKVTIEHIDQCIESLTVAVPVLEQYSRIERSITEGRFYHALRTLEDLEYSQLANVQIYAFSGIMKSRVPKMRANIKNASLTELTDFLERIRKVSTRLGVIAMRETAGSMGIDCANLLGSAFLSENEVSSSMGEKTSKGSQGSLKTVKSTDLGTKPNSIDMELEEFALISTGSVQGKATDDCSAKSPVTGQNGMCTEDLVDFGPVYRCLHIHTALHERAEFERHYCAQRRKQCQLILSLSMNQQTHMRDYTEFLGSICGFFVVDDHLRHTLSSSSSAYQTYLDELWSSTVERLVAFARLNAGSCESADELIRLKDYSVLFNRTMNSLGFNTTALYEMITWIQRRYQRLLAVQWREKFEKIIEQDKFCPIQISAPEYLPQLTNLYPQCITAEIEALSYPRQFCFSWMVPRIYAAIKEYVDLCHRFCTHVDVAWSELEDTVTRATNTLFTDCLNTVIHNNVTLSERSLPRLLQFCVNLEELETVCGHLDVYLQKLVPSSTMDELCDTFPKRSVNNESFTGYGPVAQPRSRLSGASLLNDTRTLVEDLICSHLSARVDEFVGHIDYNSLEENSTNGLDESSRKPSEHILELTRWLSTTFRLFSNIPPKITQTACISVCKRIAGTLFNGLFGPQADDLTESIMYQLSADLAHCESCARSLPIPGLDSQTVSLIFADLRQLLDLFRKDDWTVYRSSLNKKSNPYDRVSTGLVIRLLERLREADKKRAGFLQSIRKDRGRRKKWDDVIRQLRETNVASRI